MVGLIDTNLFKKLTKNLGGIHDNFVKLAGAAEVADTKWIVTPFGWLEYLGLTFRGSLQIEPMPAGWAMPDSALEQYKKTVEELGLEFTTLCYWVRTRAKEKYAQLLRTEVLNKKAGEERQYHSEAFIGGPFNEPLFLWPLEDYPAEGIVELLTIDFLHRYPDVPPDMAPMVREFCRSTTIAEHYVERRNVVLVRVFKQTWVNRTKGSHEDHVEKETMARLERAVSRLKNDADRFDHDLLAYFILGYAIGGEYEPVTIYSQDDPDDFLARLAIFYCILRSIWEEWSHLKGMGPLPIQTASRFRFVCDHGQILREITSENLGRFLLDEGLVVKQ